MGAPKIDEIGPWSEVKLDILKRYALEYSKILSNQQNPALYHVYVDAFAGAGYHISKARREMVPGSPLNALLIRPPFREYHLVDLDGDKIDGLKTLTRQHKNVGLYHGDCNEILLKQVFPRIRFADYRRGLCLLDPYKLTLNWAVIKEAGRMGTLDIFINFPIHHINRSVLHHDPTDVSESEIERMTSFWGDDSWRDVAYEKSRGLFGIMEEKVSNDTLVEAFRARLKKVAGFKRVPKPLPMRNSHNSVVYYLFFASQKDTAEQIVEHIFNKFGRVKN